MRIKDIPAESRPRERLYSLGAEALSDAELLAVILQKGTRSENVVDMCNRLLSRFAVERLCDCSLAELKMISGIGKAKAMQIVALVELSKRMRSGRIAERIVRDSSDVAKYYMERLGDKKKEHFIAVFLDSKNRIIKDEVISVGTLNSSLVHPREVFKSAIRESANAIILVHNHPSGDATMSAEDEEVTRKMKEAGEVVGIRVLDHVVVGNGKL